MFFFYMSLWIMCLTEINAVTHIIKAEWKKQSSNGDTPGGKVKEAKTLIQSKLTLFRSKNQELEWCDSDSRWYRKLSEAECYIYKSTNKVKNYNTEYYIAIRSTAAGEDILGIHSSYTVMQGADDATWLNASPLSVAAPTFVVWWDHLPEDFPYKTVLKSLDVLTPESRTEKPDKKELRKKGKAYGFYPSEECVSLLVVIEQKNGEFIYYQVGKDYATAVYSRAAFNCLEEAKLKAELSLLDKVKGKLWRQVPQ